MDKSGERISGPESSDSQVLRETVKLPSAKGEFVHIETTSGKLADTFGEFAEKFGVAKDKATQFFQDRVDFRFGRAWELPVFDNAVEDRVAKLILAMNGGQPLGYVGHEAEGKYPVRVDLEKIAEILPDLKTEGFSLKGNGPMTPEESVSGFQAAVKGVIEHEFFHIFQYMTDPEMMDKSKKREKETYRLLTVFLASQAVMNLIPELRIAILPVGLPLLGAIIYVNRNNVGKIEADAYSAQKQAAVMGLKVPIDFTTENP